MKLAKITTNGRVTIPVKLRKKYGLTLGRRVKLEATEDGIRIIPLVTREEVEANAGFLLTKGKMLGALMQEKRREREL